MEKFKNSKLSFNGEETLLKRNLPKEGISISTVIVISKLNAGTRERLEELKKYLLKLNELKANVRLDPYFGISDCELDEKRLIEVYLDLARFCLKKNLKWHPFIDVIHKLQGKPIIYPLRKTLRKALFQYFENILKFVEWPSIFSSASQGKSRSSQRDDFSSQNHGDIPHGDWSNLEHGDAPHGDSPHGDWSNF